MPEKEHISIEAQEKYQAQQLAIQNAMNLDRLVTANDPLSREYAWNRGIRLAQSGAGSMPISRSDSVISGVPYRSISPAEVAKPPEQKQIAKVDPKTATSVSLSQRLIEGISFIRQDIIDDAQVSGHSADGISKSITTLISPSGDAEFFYAAGGRLVYRRYDDRGILTSGSTVGRQINDSGVTVTPDFSVGLHANGRTSLFMRGSDNLLYHRMRLNPEERTHWSAFGQFGLEIQSAPASVQTPDKKLHLFVVEAEEGALMQRWLEPNGIWSNWVQHNISEKLGNHLAVAANSSGLLEVFVTGEDKKLYHHAQHNTLQGVEGWGKTECRGAGFENGIVSATTNRDKYIWLAGRTLNPDVYSTLIQRNHWFNGKGWQGINFIPADNSYFLPQLIPLENGHLQVK